MKKIIFITLILSNISLMAQGRFQIKFLHSESNMAAIQSKLIDNNGNDMDFRYQSVFKIWEKFDMSAHNWGPKISYFSKIRKFDYDLFIPYSIDHYKIIDQTNTDFANIYRIHSIKPTFDVRYKVGNIRKDAFPTVTLGVSYDLPIRYRETYENYKGFYKNYFKYEDPISKDLNNINSGFVLRLGFGIQTKAKRSLFSKVKKDENVSIMFSYKLYNLFNTDYTQDGIKPYEGWESKIGLISFSISSYL